MFNSTRERRLWFGAGLVVLAIYSTLAFTGVLATELRQRGLLDLGFALGFGLLIISMVALTVRARPTMAEVGAALGVAAVFLLAFTRMGTPEERTHLVEYGLLAALIYQALLERRTNGEVVRSPAFIAVTVTVVLGILDESIQWALPSRVFDLRDVGFNAGAAVISVLGSMSIGRMRGRGRQPDGSESDQA